MYYFDDIGDADKVRTSNINFKYANTPLAQELTQIQFLTEEKMYI